MSVTMNDVAQKAGVSPATVSYVLNNVKLEHVGEATRHKVLTAVSRLGYARHRTARALVMGRTHTIAFWTVRLTTNYYAAVMDFMMRLLDESGYQTHVFGTGEDYARKGRQEEFLAPPVDGIVAFDTPQFVEDYTRGHAGNTPPIVSMGASHTRTTDHVGVDLYAGTREAMAHLLQTGRRRIAYAAYDEFMLPGKSRYDAYTDAMREAGLKTEYLPVPLLTNTSYRFNARVAIREYVTAHGCPQAVFCFNDDLALGVYRGLRDLGARIPDDVALVGCDGDEDTEYVDVPISTLVLPVESMCRTAWAFLQRRLAKPDVPRQEAMLQPVFAVRDSSRGAIGGRG